MTGAPKKTIQWKPGVTIVRPNEASDDRVLPVLILCAYIAGGVHVFSDMRASATEAQVNPFLPLIFPLIGLWLFVLVLICLWFAWVLYGSINFSVSTEDLIIRECIDGRPIFTSGPIKLSTIAEVHVEERVYRMKRGTVHCWLVFARSDDGKTHRVAKFYNEPAAHELMSKLLYAEN